MGMIVLEGFTGDRVYIDSNVFIYAMEGFPKYAGLCSALLEAIDERRIHALTSELSIAEVLIKPLRDANHTAVAAYHSLIQNRPSFEVWQVSRDVLVQAAQIRAMMPCKLPDAIHAATAIAGKADFIFTADVSFKVPGDMKCVSLDDLLEENSR